MCLTCQTFSWLTRHATLCSVFDCIAHTVVRYTYLFVIYVYVFCLFHSRHINRQYNIKKKEEQVEQQPQEEPNPLMRKKKTPEELAAEAEQEDLDDFTSKWLKMVVHHFYLFSHSIIYPMIFCRCCCSRLFASCFSLFVFHCRIEKHDRKSSEWNKNATGKQMCIAVIR